MTQKILNSIKGIKNRICLFFNNTKRNLFEMIGIFYFFWKTKIIRTWASTVIFTSIIFNVVLCLGALFFFWENFRESPFLSSAVPLLCLTAVLTSLIGYISDEIMEVKLLVSIFVQSIIVILTFSGAYRGFGIFEGDIPVSGSWTKSIYFSVVTWTTLGYGDYKPAPEMHLIAAIQALSGQILSGIMVALVASRIIKQSID